MLTKTNINNAKKFCCEDISRIENYNKAINDKSDTVWDCHHKKAIELNKSKNELKEIGLYYNRPANELIFLTHSEHRRIHNSARVLSQETRIKISTSSKGKKMSDQAKAKISKAHKGKKHSTEHCEKIAKANTGRIFSQETREKISKALSVNKKKYRWLTPDGKTKTMDKSHAKRYHPDWTLVS